MTDDIYGGIPEIVAARYKRISDKYIQMIAKKLKEIGSVDTSDVHALLQLSMYGNDIQKLEKEISDLSGKTAEELSAVFDKVAEKSLAAGRTVAELRGAELQPYKYNSHLQNTVEVLRQTSLDTFTNISNTTTVAVRFTDIMGNTTYKTMGDAYKDAIDDAIHSAAMGFTDYNTEISKVLRQFSESGLRVVDYESGYSRRLDSAVRQNVLDGMRSVYQGVQTRSVGSLVATGWKYPLMGHARRIICLTKAGSTATRILRKYRMSCRVLSATGTAVTAGGGSSWACQSPRTAKNSCGKWSVTRTSG